ncbi:MAG: HAMP domain-containing histidine kinase [Chloroflexi bacterium]|nr:HAMP domain-containing histidine kinase [Chloroflexota bacterium]
MINTLRWRLVLSHVLPLLIITPLTGIALIYVLETQILLPHLARELTDETNLVARLAINPPGILYNATEAQSFVDQIGPLIKPRMVLYDAQGNFLATSRPENTENQALPPDFPLPLSLSENDVRVHTAYSQNLQRTVADVVIPIRGVDHQVIGIIRLTSGLGSIYEQFITLRFIIAGVLILGLLLGAVVGWLLALNLESPLAEVAQAVNRLASGQPLALLPENGPEEVRIISHAVNTLVARLENLEQARRQLLSNLVHELSRPMGALQSAIQALRRGADQDEILRQELLAGMEEMIHRLRRVTDDLAGLYDQVLGRLELNRRPIAPGEWLIHQMAPWREVAQQKGISWHSSIPPSLPTIEVDPDRLGQAIGNLLSNATKYTPAGGAITLSVDVQDNEIRLRICDTGPGIPLDEQEQIFKPFYRGRQNPRFPQGMGLGLGIAQDLISAHGGRLGVESVVGKGSCFTICLPC